jgi:hypothetical protein
LSTTALVSPTIFLTSVQSKRFGTTGRGEVGGRKPKRLESIDSNEPSKLDRTPSRLWLSSSSAEKESISKASSSLQETGASQELDEDVTRVKGIDADEVDDPNN